MILNDIDINCIQFDDVPVDYLWSGYAHSVEKFKEYNFLCLDYGKDRLYVCSSDNGVALGDYLSGVIYRGQVISDMERIFISDMDYWFCLAFECNASEYDQLEDWFKSVVELLIQKGLIRRVSWNGTDFFLFSDLANYEDDSLPQELIDETKSVCKKHLLERFEERFVEEGFDERINLKEQKNAESHDVFDCFDSLFDFTDWTRSVFEEFIESRRDLK